MKLHRFSGNAFCLTVFLTASFIAVVNVTWLRPGSSDSLLTRGSHLSFPTEVVGNVLPSQADFKYNLVTAKAPLIPSSSSRQSKSPREFQEMCRRRAMASAWLDAMKSHPKALEMTLSALRSTSDVSLSELYAETLIEILRLGSFDPGIHAHNNVVENLRGLIKDWATFLAQEQKQSTGMHSALMREGGFRLMEKLGISVNIAGMLWNRTSLPELLAKDARESAPSSSSSSFLGKTDSTAGTTIWSTCYTIVLTKSAILAATSEEESSMMILSSSLPSLLTPSAAISQLRAPPPPLLREELGLNEEEEHSKKQQQQQQQRQSFLRAFSSSLAGVSEFVAIRLANALLKQGPRLEFAMRQGDSYQVDLIARATCAVGEWAVDTGWIFQQEEAQRRRRRPDEDDDNNDEKAVQGDLTMAGKRLLVQVEAISRYELDDEVALFPLNFWNLLGERTRMLSSSISSRARKTITEAFEGYFDAIVRLLELPPPPEFRDGLDDDPKMRASFRDALRDAFVDCELVLGTTAVVKRLLGVLEEEMAAPPAIASTATAAAAAAAAASNDLWVLDSQRRARIEAAMYGLASTLLILQQKKNVREIAGRDHGDGGGDALELGKEGGDVQEVMRHFKLFGGEGNNDDESDGSYRGDGDEDMANGGGTPTAAPCFWSQRKKAKVGIHSRGISHDTTLINGGMGEGGETIHPCRKIWGWHFAGCLQQQHRHTHATFYRGSGSSSLPHPAKRQGGGEAVTRSWGFLIGYLEDMIPTLDAAKNPDVFESPVRAVSAVGEGISQCFRRTANGSRHRDRYAALGQKFIDVFWSSGPVGEILRAQTPPRAQLLLLERPVNRAERAICAFQNLELLFGHARRLHGQYLDTAARCFALSSEGGGSGWWDAKAVVDLSQMSPRVLFHLHCMLREGLRLLFDRAEMEEMYLRGVTVNVGEGGGQEQRQREEIYSGSSKIVNGITGAIQRTLVLGKTSPLVPNSSMFWGWRLSMRTNYARSR
eukprot:jgi/Bigna1/72236/fgenesh1_pg.19_\